MTPAIEDKQQGWSVRGSHEWLTFEWQKWTCADMQDRFANTFSFNWALATVEPILMDTAEPNPAQMGNPRCLTS